MAIDSIGHDVRFALRQLAARPGLTLAALLALTCGLGGVVTVFTLVDAVILRPLPVASPQELVWLRDPSFSFPVFQEVRVRAGMLTNAFAWDVGRMQAQWSGEPEPAPVLLATGGIYETLGLRPAVGRLLTDADVGETAAAAQAVAVLSYDAWQRRYGGDPAAIGGTLRLEGVPFTIVGVTPKGFHGVAVGVPVEVTIPVTMLPRLREEERDALTSASRSWLHIMGRLRPGVSVAAGDAQFQAIWPQILQATAVGVRPSFRPRYLTFTSGLEPGASGYSRVRRQFADALWLLFGLVGLLLVAACATVANLSLASASARQHELALRLAIGAGRGRIARQLVVEGLLLGLAGGALALLFSTWAADLLVRLLSTSYDAVVVDVTPDGRIVAFVAVAVALTTLGFTLAPVLRTTRLGPISLSDGGARQAGSLHRARLAPVLVTVQVAVSLALLAGSALFVRNLRQILTTDVGFTREDLLVVAADARSPLSRVGREPSDGALVAYYDELLRRLRELPGVASASLSQKAPISNEQGSWWDRFTVEGGSAIAALEGRTLLNAISPGYFATTQTAILAGRDFTPADRAGAPNVAIVNAALARAYFGDASPIGRRLLMGDERTPLEVVGVVRDAAYQYVRERRPRIAYLPFAQIPLAVREQGLVAEVRAGEPSVATAEAITKAVRAFDPAVPLTIQSVEARIDESLVAERLLAVIAAFLAATALVLACGALGGLLSHLVTARTREIGVRLALGAPRASVLRLILTQALVVAVAGGAAGLALTVAGGRILSRFLTAVGPADPVSLGAAAAILLATTVLAGWVPARRAARVDPIVALRSE
jgi:predicted permease